MQKVYPDARAALAGLLKDGMLIMAGGFGLCGVPEQLILAIRDSGVKNLTVVSNNCGIDGVGLGILLDSRQIKKMISSYVGENKEQREFEGAHYVLERGLIADLSIVHAWIGDTEGNLVYRKTARNFNPMMATAGKVTVAEVEHLMQPGDINPDHIITSGIYVKRLVHVPNAVKHIEQRTVRKHVAAPAGTGEEV